MSSADFEVVILGAGDSFSERHHPTSLLLLADDFRLGIDCPDMYRGVLRDASAKSGRLIELPEIDHLLVTHVHGDHMNGLEGVGFFKHFAEKKRLDLYTSAEARSVIWERRLRAPMEQLWDGVAFRPMTFEDYFRWTELGWSTANRIGPFSIRTYRTKHHVTTTALLVEYRGRTLGYSADTAFDPALIDFLSQADLIIHETNYGPAHTAYADLAALPDRLRGKMRLIHYPDQLDLENSVIIPAREGEILRVGAQ